MKIKKLTTARIVQYQVKNKRLFWGLTQVKLAKKAKISQATIAQIESGRREPSFKVLDKLSKALHCDPWSFLVPGYEENV